jgi:hypothetical protein
LNNALSARRGYRFGSRLDHCGESTMKPSTLFLIGVIVTGLVATGFTLVHIAIAMAVITIMIASLLEWLK